MDSETDIPTHENDKGPNDATMGSDVVTSSAAETRKSSKPIMEKRRRARINASLAELKSFLLDIIKKEGLRHNKMEKADILELTVKHLRQLQREQLNGGKLNNELEEDTFRKGFAECAVEVTKFLKNIPDTHPNLQARLLEHLVRCRDLDNANFISKSTQMSANPTVQTGPNLQLPLPVTATGCLISENIKKCIEQVPESTLQYCKINTSESTNVNQIFKTQNITTHSVFQPSNTLNGTLNTTNVTSNTSNGISNTSNGFSSPKDKVAPLLNSFQQVNLNSNIQVGNVGNNSISGLQIIPTRLDSGQTAYIIPANIFANTCFPNYIVPCINLSARQPINTNISPTTQMSPILCIPKVQNMSSNAQQTNDPKVERSNLTNISSLGIPFSTQSTASVGISNNNNVVGNTQEHVHQNRVPDDPVWRPW